MTRTTAAPPETVCAHCGEAILVADGCVDRVFPLRGGVYLPVLYGHEAPRGARRHEPPTRCPACHTRRERAHHPGCEREECPRCGGAVLTCGCADPRWS